MDFNISSKPERKIMTGDEHFTFYGMPINKLFSDFVMWYSSDLLDISIRGPLAEFIVAQELEIDFTEARSDNQGFDLRYKGNCLEIKSSAYLQSWEQTRPSNISFSIKKAIEKEGWFYADDERSPDIKRHSIAYVFCLYKYRDKPTANPLILDHWDFYILPTSEIDKKCGDQKNLSLNKLLELNPVKCEFDGIKDAIDSIINSITTKDKNN